MSTYQLQVRCPPGEIDIDFWREPEGVTIPDDELDFLLVPHAVEAMAAFDLAQQVHRYQRAAAAAGAAITRGLMATMGGLLPGILLYDHLAAGRPPDIPPIAFGSIGVSLYKGPDERHDGLHVTQDMTIAVQDAVVLLIDDLSDRGDTMRFLTGYAADQGAKEVLTLAMYMKPAAANHCPADFSFGTVGQDTWIITPREYAETLARRVPVWKERGASLAECRRRLIDLIGYPPDLVDYYLEPVFNAAP